jgi:hypothetical protein
MTGEFTSTFLLTKGVGIAEAVPFLLGELLLSYKIEYFLQNVK